MITCFGFAIYSGVYHVMRCRDPHQDDADRTSLCALVSFVNLMGFNLDAISMILANAQSSILITSELVCSDQLRKLDRVQLGCYLYSVG